MAKRRKGFAVMDPTRVAAISAMGLVVRRKHRLERLARETWQAAFERRDARREAYQAARERWEAW